MCMRNHVQICAKLFSIYVCVCVCVICKNNWPKYLANSTPQLGTLQEYYHTSVSGGNSILKAKKYAMENENGIWDKPKPKPDCL